MKQVAMVGCEGPGRTALLAALLSDCIERHGWTQRVQVRAFGVLAGSGVPTPAEAEAARSAGLATENLRCASIDEGGRFVGNCELIVAVSDAAAELVIETGQAEGKPLLCLQDLVDGEAAALLQSPCEAVDLIESLAPEMPELLRKLIAV